MLFLNHPLHLKFNLFVHIVTYQSLLHAMTATAYKHDRRHIKESLGLVANSDRKKIFYEKAFRYRQDIDALEDICMRTNWWCSACNLNTMTMTMFICCIECSLDFERECFYQMNIQLITTVNFVELNYLKVDTSCTMFTLSHIYVIICI
jgi:hypothetical protein